MNPRTPLERKMRNEVRRLREEEERRALSSMRQGYAYGKRGTLDRMDDYRDQLVDRAGKLLARQTSKVAREMPGPKAHGMREFSRDMIKLLRDERARERAHVSREIDHANREDYRRAKEGMEYNQRKDEAQIVKLTRTVAGTRKSILDELQESLAQLDDLAKGRKRVNTSPFFAVQERGKRQANGISSQGKGDGTARDPIRPSGKNDDANRPAHTFVTQREKQHTDKSFSMDDAYEAMVPWFFGGPTAPRDPGLRQPFQKSTKPNINELVAFNQRTYGFTRLDTLKRLAKSHGFSPESFMFDDLLIKAVPADATAAFGGEKAREKAPPPPPPPNPKDPNVARLESVADRAAGTPTVTPPPPKPASAAAPLPAKPAITGGGTRTQRQTTGMLPHVAAAAAFKEVDPLSDQGHQIMLAHSQSRGWDHGLDETGRMGINTQIGAREAAHSLASLAAAGIVGSYKSPHELEFDNDDHKAEWMASHGLSDASTANIIKTGFEDKGKHIIMVNVHGASGKPEQMMMTFDRNAGGWVPAGGVDAYGRVHNSGDETHEYAKRIGNMLNHYVGDADKFTDQNTLVVNSANARVRNSLHGNMDKNFVNAWSKINTVNNIGQNQADQWHDAAMNRYLAAMNGGKGRMSSPISSPGAAATQTTPQPVQETVQETAQKTGVENVAESPNAPQLTHLAEQYRTANKIKAADKDHINEYYKNISSGNSNITRKEFLQHIIDDPEGMASGSWDDIVSQDEHKGIAGNEELKKHWIALHAAEYKKNAQELLDEENNASAASDADAETTVIPPGADADADPNAQFTNEHKSILSDLAKAKAEKVFVNKDGSLVNKLNVAYPSSLRRGVETNGVSEEWKNSLSDFLRQNNIPDTQEAHDHFMQQYLDHYEKIHNDKFGSGGDAPADAAATTDTDTAPDPDATSGPADLDAINPDTGISLRTYGRIADFEGKKAKKAIIQGKTLDDFLKKFDDPRFGWGTEYSDPATSDKARETYKKESKKAYEDAYAKWHDTLSENNITDEQKSLLSNKAKQQAEGHVDQLTKETSDERSPSVIQSVLQDPRHQNHDASNEKGFYSSFRKVIADPNGIPDTKEAYDHYIQQFLDHYEKAHNDKFGLHNFSPEQLIERHHGQIDESGHGEKTDKVLKHI
jgi:hypothetical protein